MGGDRQTNHLGLTSDEVADRHRQGQSNLVDDHTSRPIRQILRANIFTVFNAILTAAIVAVLVAGYWQDIIFGVVMVLNACIGVFSEVRAKRALDSVAVLEAPRSRAWRDGELRDILSTYLVVDDVIELHLGDQVPADGQVLSVAGMEIDESVLTGESLPVVKALGDPMLSGTAVVAGSGTMRVEKIGKDAWIQNIAAEAKTFSLVVSEIHLSINKVLRWITWLIPPVAVLLYWSQVRGGEADWRVALVAAVAGIVGMIPQGLVLLTSMNFGLAAAALARRGVLVQELPAVEVLARVDTLCLDKTGTLTTGGIQGLRLVSAPSWEAKRGTGVAILARLTQDDANASATAIHALVQQEIYTKDDHPYEEVPFSSSRKWSALVGQSQTWVLGAPEVLLAQAADSPDLAWAETLVAKASEIGVRTLCLACAEGRAKEATSLPEGLHPVMVAELEEEIRPDAAEVLQYFRDQQVKAVVISGDATRTVSAIATQVGLAGTEGAELISVDARTLPEPDDPEFAKIALQTQVFGRVRPDQKRDLVRALQANGRTVAMTGDGVNDALALKEAKLGIAMGNGAPATKAVSRMVLMNGEFSVLPGVVAEGRRIIANMERVASLFLSKTTYAILLAVVVSVAGWKYPLLPRHLTYIGWFTIGTPAFFLALGPNFRKYVPGFLRRTLLIAVPAGLIMGSGSLWAYMLVGEGTTAGSTAGTLTLIIMALWLLGITARPVNSWRALLIIVMASGAVFGILIPGVRLFFALDWPELSDFLIIAGIGSIGCLLIEATRWFTAPLRESIGKGER